MDGKDITFFFLAALVAVLVVKLLVYNVADAQNWF